MNCVCASLHKWLLRTSDFAFLRILVYLPILALFFPRLQSVLVNFQKKQIDSFESWLTDMEKDMSEFDQRNLGGFDDVKKQLDEVQVIL